MSRTKEKQSKGPSVGGAELLKPQQIDLTKLPRTVSPNHVHVYANHANISTTVLDVRLVFGQMLLLPHELRIEDYASVTMTWEQAERVRELLNRVIDAKEKANLDLSPAP